ncbi:ion transporter [Amycolatopsis sp. NPDC058278]|uniref:ion transporter n=1 Tax=Amycolatopsis sp. NPDC058278 TaxID=3346417 RepID=UPI0036DA6AA8
MVRLARGRARLPDGRQGRPGFGLLAAGARGALKVQPIDWCPSARRTSASQTSPYPTTRKFYAYRGSFFRDNWNVFDLLVVGIAVIPATGPFAVLRSLRVLRVLRLISVVPSMRKVVSGLLAAIPGMASIAALLALIIFVAGVMATKLFGTIDPGDFGDLGTSLFTLFQVMTGEAWPDIAKTIMEQAPMAWVFFVVYILVSSFAVLNLFIAVVVSGMEDELRQDIREEEAKQAETQAAANQEILDELRALRAELAELRQKAA